MTLFKKISWWKKLSLSLVLILVLSVIVYLLGPKVPEPNLTRELPKLYMELSKLDSFIENREKGYANLKPGNQSELIWYDSIKQTPYAIVYLHGYSASPREGDPLHEEIAERYGANLYLPRLEGHGLADENAFVDLTPEKFLSSAKEAIAIGKLLGRKVILMCSSTGGTAGLYLAANDPDIAGILLYSPNVALYDPKSSLLTGPWGLAIGRKVFGGTHRGFEANETVQKYWTNSYRIEGLIYMIKLVQTTMTPETFEKVTAPVFLAYYFKNKEEQDQVISVKKALEMYDQLGTPTDLKRKEAFPNAGQHVLASKYYSEDLPAVRKSTFSFLEEIIGLKSN